MSDESTNDALYCIVVNEQTQYSLWLHHRPVPAGWRLVGPVGSKPECLAFVEKVWTDITPASVGQSSVGSVRRD
jgi:MbtH protein